MFKKLKRIKERFDTMAMAVAFAEAGEWKTAEQLMDELKPVMDSPKPKMLFASADREFSPTVIDYAVNLAQRLKLDILALNIFQPLAGSSCLAVDVDGKGRKHYQQLVEMQDLLRKRTGEMGIGCNQALLKDDLRSAITWVSRLMRRIEVVIIQRNQKEDPYLNLNIPVYMVAPRESRQK